MLKRQENEAAEAAEMLAKIREEEEKLKQISDNTNTRDELRVCLIKMLFLQFSISTYNGYSVESTV